jgi:excinuclease UvrABC nuclease subunit
LKKAIQQATEKMNSASKNLEFMEAAQYRDEIKALEKRISEI